MYMKTYYYPEASERFLYEVRRVFLKLFFLCRLLFIAMVLTANYERCSLAFGLFSEHEITTAFACTYGRGWRRVVKICTSQG